MTMTKSIISVTDQNRSKESLKAWYNKDRRGWGVGPKGYSLSSKEYENSEFVGTSPTDHLIKNQEKREGKAKRIISDKGHIQYSYQFTQSKKILFRVRSSNISLYGLPGGGCMSSKKKLVAAAPQEHKPMILSDEVMINLPNIEAGIRDGRYDLVFGGLSRIRNWENTLRPSDAAMRLIRLLCDPTSEGLPYLAKERIIEKLPVLLFLVLKNPDLVFTKKFVDEMTEGISNLQVNNEVVGGPEVSYYRDLCLMMVNKFPSPTDWASLSNTMSSLATIGIAFFNPFSVDLDTIKTLYSLGQAVCHLFQNQRENSLLSEYVRVQSLKIGVLNEVEGSLEEFVAAAKARDSRVFVRKTCLFCVKQLMLTIKNDSVQGRLEDLLLELVEDEQLQNMAIRVCLEVGSYGYFNALKWIEDRKESLLKTPDVLKRRLLIDSDKIRRDFEQTSINWEALEGISPKNYSNAVRAFRDECSETEMIYVDIEVSETERPDSESFPVLSKVTEFLDDSSLKVLVLLGNPGSGKSLFCQRLGKYLLESYNSYFPLYGYLPAIDNRKTGFANHCLDKRSLFPASEEFTNRKILFILDAYDEISEKVNLIKSNEFFSQFPECKVLITCRTHEVNSLDNFVRSGAGPRRIKERKILYIRPFSTKKIKEYIDKVCQSPYVKEENEGKPRESPEEIWTQIESIPKLKAMMDTPFMLRICLYNPSFLRKINERNLTKFGIYARFMKSYHKDNIYKLKDKDVHTELQEYTEACIDYAFEIMNRGKIEWNHKRAKEQIHIRAGCPLKKISSGKEGEATELTFIHPSVQEYFVALRFRQILESIHPPHHQFTDQDLAQFNVNFVCDKVNILNFVADYLNDDHKEVLLNVLRIKQTNFRIASANSITILNCSGYSFAGMDLRGIQIEGADLSGGNFAKTDFSGSNMKNVNLTETCLDLANLCDCDLRQAIFRERAPLQGHDGGVSSVSFSLDGRYVVSGSMDSTIRVWDLETSTALCTLQGHENYVTSVNFSGEGRYVVSGSYDKTVRVWDLETSTAILTLQGHSEPVTSVSFSPEGKNIVSGSLDKTIRVWDLQTSTTLHTLQGDSGPISSIVISTDGRYVASGSWDGKARVWDLHTSAIHLTLQGHALSVSSVSFSADGKYLASSSQDRTIKVWDLQTSAILHTLQGHSLMVNYVIFSADGKYLVSSSEDDTVRVWDLEASATLHILQGDSDSFLGAVTSVSFSVDGRYVASGSEDSTIKVWELETSTSLVALQGHVGDVNSVSFSADGRYVASGSEDNTVRVWDLETSTALHTLQGESGSQLGAVTSVGFSPDGRYLACGSDDKTVRVWDLETSTKDPKSTLKGHTKYVTSVSFSPDGKYIASSSQDMTVRIWDLETSTSEPKQILEAHSGVVNFVSFSADGRYLATGSEDNMVRVWDLEKSTALHNLQGHTSSVRSVSFSADGRYIASGSYDCTVRIWDLETSATIVTLKGHSDVVESVRFSPDARYVASGSGDNTVRIWDLQTSTDEPKHTLNGHSALVTSLSFLPDGKYIASGSYDDTVKVWDLQQNQDFFTRVTNQFAYSLDGDTIVEYKDNKILKARNLLNGEVKPEYPEGTDILDYPLNIVKDPKTDILPLHLAFSKRPRAYGVLFNGALISKRNLELLVYKRYKI